MNDEIKEILEKPNVYSFNDECYLYFGDYNKLKDYITNLQQESKKLKKENELLKEELTNLKNDITRVYNTMISLETINKQELEEIEEI